MKTEHIKTGQKYRFTFRQILEGLEGIAIIIACYLTFFLKPIRSRWGISKADANRTFPGDELLAHPKAQFTHAILIDAPAASVWPWVAQIGQGRGGFYSYEALENITGLNIYNADEVLPEFQNPKLGDLIYFSPQDAYPVVVCQDGQAMAIENWFDMDAGKEYDPKLSSPKNYMHLTWLWHIESLGENRSRFISRNRIDYNSSIKNKVIFGFLMEPVVFAMDRKMCLGIKKRAERLFEKRS